MLTRSFSFVLALFLSSAALAQTPRVAPSQSYPTQEFVEVAEQGARGDFQIIGLRVRQAGTCHTNPYGPAVTTTSKAVDDILIYDRNTGHALLVTTAGPFYGATGLYISESFKFWTLREGVEWDALDLDGDGNDDLIGYVKATGEVIRAYRKNVPTC